MDPQFAETLRRGSFAYDLSGGGIHLLMSNDKNLPATVRTNSALPQSQPGSLVARGLAAVQQSLAAAKQENAESLFKKGMRFRNGEVGTPQDDEKARACLLAAAKLNHAEAQFELSLFLGEFYDWPEAVVWLEKSVLLGFGPAQQYLGEQLSEPLIADNISNPSYNEFDLYRQAAAWYAQRANAGDTDAQYGFAQMLRNPELPNYNPETAMRWMKAAAKQDHGFACWRLGEWLLDDRDPQHNTEQGIYWLSRAAKLGKSHACQRLGDLYLLGHMGGRYASTKGEKISQLVVPNKKAAVAWYERQIELERERGSFMGTPRLARLYLSEDHLDQDLARAERLLLHAADGGDLDSQRLLASEYASGKRLKRNPTAALHWLKMAEQNGSSSKLQDQFQLGCFYEHDSDDAPKYSEAIIWYRKAADHGHYRSLKSLGSLYESGCGVLVDYVQAYKWYGLSVAASYGKAGLREFHAAAIKTRDLLAEKMTSSQRAQARLLASKWLDDVVSMEHVDYELAKEGLEKSAS